MIFDNHVHVGWYTDRYHAPREVWDSAVAAGVDGMAVSSTSTCAELYKVVVRELRELVRLGGSRVRPILWLTPRMMKTRYALPYMLHSKAAWCGVKMHWGAHREWYHNSRLLAQALVVARKLDVPVLLHTGEQKECEAAVFEPLCVNNPDLTFVLAHGRPIDQTISILKRHGNAFVDTAFMPAESLEKLMANGLQDKVLFGTDSPINEVFFNTSTTDYISDKISRLKDVCGQYGDEIIARTVYL